MQMESCAFVVQQKSVPGMSHCVVWAYGEEYEIETDAG